MKRAIALYSGGKDSHYSVLHSYRQGVAVEALVVAAPSREDSWLFHSVNVPWSTLHGEAMSLPVYVVPVSGVRDVELVELGNHLRRALERHQHVDYLVVGAVKSRYQLEKFKALSEELGLRLYAPLWALDEVELLRMEVEELSFIVTAVQAYCLDLRILGTLSSRELFNRLLKAREECGASLVGEGGEYETYVIGSPLFRGRGIAISRARIVLRPREYSGYFIIEDARLA